MKRLILFALCITPLWPAACTLTDANTGSACKTPVDKSCSLSAIAADTHANWSGAGCTAAGFVPGNGDTVVIPDGFHLTVDRTWTIGASGANNTTAAIDTKQTGVVEVSGGVTLTARGDLISNCTAGDCSGYLTASFIFDAGSKLVFDSSASSSPTTTRYRMGAPLNSDTDRRPEQFNGTSGSHVTVTSIGGTALNGQFRSGTATVGTAGDEGPCIVATYTDFSYIGDGAANGEGFEWGGKPCTYTMQHSTFDHTGPSMTVGRALRGGAGTTFLVDHNVFTNSLGATNFWATVSETPTTSTYTVSNNVFDKRYNDSGSGCGAASQQGVAFSNNFFADSDCASAYAANAPTMVDNFYISHDTADTGKFQIPGSVSGGYFFADVTGANNFHGVFPNPSAASTVSESVIEVPEDFVPGSQDSGEMCAACTGAGSHAETFSNLIQLPSRTGKGTMELGAFTHSAPSVANLFSAFHNTWPASNGFGMMQMNEGGASLAPVAALESNLAWSTGGTYCKVSTYDGASVLLNPVTLADYNSADQYVTLNAVSTGCSVTCSNAVCANQGNGYIGNWTVTPGTHDLAANPYLADPLLRNVALWDTKYLGHAAATAWNGSSHSYNVGDLVSDSHAGYWSGSAVNFRCIASHTSDSTTEPNVGASWRTDWTWESLNDIKTAIAADTTYTDGAIGCAGCTAIQALVKWVQRGYIPQNPAFWCSGHDGETIGAVPFCAAGKVLIGAMAGM